MAAMNEIWSGECRYLLSLYWLAFLLTECEELSIRIVVEAFDALEDPRSLRRESKQIRNALIENALSETRSADPGLICRANYVQGIREPVAEIGWEQLQAGLLSLDTFSRRTLLLTVFEGYTAEQTARLLGQNVETVLETRTTALIAFTGSFTRKSHAL
jgi:hypothetical protein